MNIWQTEITAWSLALRAKRSSEQTIALRTYHLRRLAAWAGDRSPWSLTLDDLNAWTGSQTWKRETARSVRSSLRRFWSWGVLTGRTSTDPARELEPIAPTAPNPKPAPPQAVVVALREADARVLIMLRLANELGMRRGEVAQVHSRDLNADLLGWSINVHGKGAKERVLPLPADLARLLLRLPEGYAFPGAIDGHLSAKWVGKLVARALPGESTMHNLRHLCATELLHDTKNLRVVQEVMGHASLATTQRYTKVTDSELADAIRNRSRAWSA